MGRLGRRRLQKLEEKSGYQRMTLVCPVCFEEFTAYGDVALELLTLDWREGSGETVYRETPEDIKRIYKHEHDPSSFIEKTRGLPWLSREVSGLNFGATLEDPNKL